MGHYAGVGGIDLAWQHMNHSTQGPVPVYCVKTAPVLNSARVFMLSYRHAYHAGNHADVLKHLVLVSVLRYLQRKEAAIRYVDTHAGRGQYSLNDDVARRLSEADAGAALLWNADSSAGARPAAIDNYIEILRGFNPDGDLKHYPGSPAIAAALLRPQDRAELFELHPVDSEALADLFKRQRKQLRVRAGDGLAGLKSVLPPLSRRGLILIDPSYEVKAEYAQVVNALIDARRRFANGVYMIWYPLLARPEVARLPGKLTAVAGNSWLDIKFRVRADAADGFGMAGSGLFIVNPPYVLKSEMQACLPWLVAHLAQDNGADYQLDGQG